MLMAIGQYINEWIDRVKTQSISYLQIAMVVNAVIMMMIILGSSSWLSNDSFIITKYRHKAH